MAIGGYQLATQQMLPHLPVRLLHLLFASFAKTVVLLSGWTTRYTWSTRYIWSTIHEDVDLEGVEQCGSRLIFQSERPFSAVGPMMMIMWAKSMMILLTKKMMGMLVKRMMILLTKRMMAMLVKRMMMTMMSTIQEEHTVWVSLGSLPTLPNNWTITEAR